MLLSRAVLQALAAASKASLASQLGYAQVLLDTSCALHADLDTPLLNFTRFLLKVGARVGGLPSKDGQLKNSCRSTSAGVSRPIDDGRQVALEFTCI